MCNLSIALCADGTYAQSSHSRLIATIPYGPASIPSRGHILVDQLVAQGVKPFFCVPGETTWRCWTACGADIQVTVCRQEGGAAMTHGSKLTGEPGICMVTRAAGASNALAGVHIAKQDSRR